MRLNYDEPLTYGQDSFVALAGPAVNLLFGAIALAMGWQLVAALTLVVGAFNLLPVLPLDGGRVIYGLLAGRLDPDWAERLMTALSGCLVGALVGQTGNATGPHLHLTIEKDNIRLDPAYYVDLS